jgi:hypothetical protein
VLHEFQNDIIKTWGMRWGICNIRVFEFALDDYEESKLSCVWHRDGMPMLIKKILVYVDGLSKRSGTTELKLNQIDEPVTLDGGPGSCLLFTPDMIVHRAKPVPGVTRKTIEITLAPEFINSSLSRQVAGNNALYPRIQSCHTLTK